MPEYAALITVLILDRPLCLDCIAAKTDMTVPSVRGYLERIDTSLTVQWRADERCQACGNLGLVVSIGRPE